MKTKNVKVNFKDVKAGVTAYVAHPIYGIEKIVFTGQPYMHKTVGSHFVCVKEYLSINDEIYYGTRSLRDMGITSQYNDRRTFFKLKHADAWVTKWKNDPGFIDRHMQHEALNDLYDDFVYWNEEHLDEA